MKERPIIFNAEMVRAILDGRKTMTRRILKDQPEFDFGVNRIVLIKDPWHNEAFVGTPAEGMGKKGKRELVWHLEDFSGNLVGSIDIKCPHGQLGDILWVREAITNGLSRAIYAADRTRVTAISTKDGLPMTVCFFRHTIPSIHMPRWASRIVLEIVNVRVERLQDISEEDALKEGCVAVDGGNFYKGHRVILSPIVVFKHLWQSIYGSDSWQQNPWVWCVEFKKII